VGASGPADALQATCLLLASVELRGNSAGHGFIGWWRTDVKPGQLVEPDRKDRIYI
jgi:hypothetical protein